VKLSGTRDKVSPASTADAVLAVLSLAPRTTPDATVLRGNSLGSIIAGWCSAVTNGCSIENKLGCHGCGGDSRHVWVGSRKDELPSGAASPGGFSVLSRASSYLISLSTVSIQAPWCRAGQDRTG